MVWDMDTFSLNYSNTLTLRWVLAKLVQWGKPFQKLPWLNASALKGRKSQEKNGSIHEGEDQLKHEVEELTMRLSGKDAEIAILKAELLTSQTEGPGTAVVQALERENAELRTKVIALQEKAI